MLLKMQILKKFPLLCAIALIFGSNYKFLNACNF